MAIVRGSMYQNSAYVGLKSSPPDWHFGAKVYTIWVHGTSYDRLWSPLPGMCSRCTSAALFLHMYVVSSPYATMVSLRRPQVDRQVCTHAHILRCCCENRCMHTSGGRRGRLSEEAAPPLTQTGISVLCVDESERINQCNSSLQYS